MLQFYYAIISALSPLFTSAAATIISSYCVDPTRHIRQPSANCLGKNVQPPVQLCHFLCHLLSVSVQPYHTAPKLLQLCVTTLLLLLHPLLYFRGLLCLLLYLLH